MPVYNGTPNNDVIDGGVDPDQLNGDEGDDYLAGQAGADTLDGGRGADTLFGGSENDSLDGGSGDDSIFGNEGNDTLYGGDAIVRSADRVAFQWNDIPDPHNGGQIDDGDPITSGTQAVNGVNVSYSVPSGMARFENENQYVNGIDTGSGTINDNSSMDMRATGDVEIGFSEAVENVEFRINNFDAYNEHLVIRAYDANNNLIEFNATLGSNVVGVDTDAVAGVDTFEGAGGEYDDDEPEGSLFIQIPGPVARIEMDFTSVNNWTLTVTDIYFDDPASVIEAAEAGDDTLDGGTGDDVMAGGDGDDVFVLYDGSGNDQITDFDIGDDDGDGFTNDQFDVSSLTNAAGDPVSTSDVVVTNDGSGNALLTFPNGESVTLLGVSPSQMSTEAQLNAAGIPFGELYVVEGTATGDLINGAYSDDPDGDMIDAGDNLAGNNDDVVKAGDGNDTVFSGLGDDSVLGEGGADLIYGDSGNDTLHGGEGDDSLNGGSGNDFLTGGDGADTLNGSSGNDTLDGGAGNDWFMMTEDHDQATIIGGDDFDFLGLYTYLSTDGVTVTFTGDGAGTADYIGSAGHAEFSEIEYVDTTEYADTINASATTSGIEVAGLGGDDSITGGAGNDYLYGGTGNDRITGADGHDYVLGGDGNDSILGDAGADSLFGGVGNDTIRGGDGNDWIEGGDGADAIYADNGDDTVSGGGGNDTIVGGSGENALSGDDGNDYIWGGTDSDTISGGAGGDWVSSGAGTDLIHGGDGVDILRGGAGDDTMWGEAGSDRFLVSDSETGSDEIHGGEDAGDTDVDALTFYETNSGQGVSVTFVGGQGGNFSFDNATTDGRFWGIEQVNGTEENDTFDASAETEGSQLSGWGGDDTIIGGQGADTISGGGDNDSILGGQGNDSLSAGAGNDTVYGGDGGDIAWGGAGDDLLAGGDGADYLQGEDGADTIEGGAGNDHLTGGAGDDVFVLQDGSGHDQILDFDVGDDDGDGFTNDQFDVTNLLDASGNPVNAWDVVVSDDGSGNAVLTFPNGESVKLVGVSPAQMSTAAQMNASGIPCFTSGARILTPHGEVPIDRLRAGDLVTTRDNGPQRIAWIGQRRLDSVALAAQPNLRPILIRKGTLGATRDMLVSPQHGMFVDQGQGNQSLIRAKHLVDVPGSKARVANGRRSVTYVHVMFEQHQVIFGDGAISESFYPGPIGMSALDLPSRVELFDLFPDLAGVLTSPKINNPYGASARPMMKRKDLKHLRMAA